MPSNCSSQKISFSIFLLGLNINSTSPGNIFSKIESWTNESTQSTTFSHICARDLCSGSTCPWLSSEGWAVRNTHVPSELGRDLHSICMKPTPWPTYMYRDSLTAWHPLTSEHNFWLTGCCHSTLLAGWKGGIGKNKDVFSQPLRRDTPYDLPHPDFQKLSLNYLFIKRPLNWFQMEVRRLLLHYSSAASKWLATAGPNDPIFLYMLMLLCKCSY